jgi:ABC-type Na+ transport system ATPase subunit NatA
MSLRNSWVLALFFLLSMALIILGIVQFKDIETERIEFQKVEKSKVTQWNNYTQYGGYGIYLYFMPSPLSIFFNNTNLFTELTAHVDVGERSNISKSFKGKKLFAHKQKKLWDFAGIVLLFGSFMALYYGYEAFRDREYLKFLAGLFGEKRVFRLLFVSRLILLCTFISYVTICGVLLIIIAGIEIKVAEFYFILLFFFLMLLMMLFFLSIGTAAGGFGAAYGKKGRRIGRFIVIVMWIGFVYLIPASIDKVVEIGASKIKSNYQSELEKIKRLMGFEDFANEEISILLKETGRKLSREDIARLAEEYKNKGFKKLQEIEEKLNKDIKKYIDVQQALSMLFPSTFYLSITNEISSRGYENLLEFHKYAKTTKDKFMDFYVEKKPYHQSGQPVESFVKKDENIYPGECRVPWNFWWGLLVTVFWIGGVVKLSYFLYRKSLFGVPKEIILGLNDLDIDVEKGKSNVVFSRGETVRQHLYNVLSGKNKVFNGRVLIDGKDIVPGNKGIDFVYICYPDEIPGDIKAGNFISFLWSAFKVDEVQLNSIRVKLDLNKFGKKSFNELEDKYKLRGQLVMTAALFKKSNIYVINNLAKGMPADFIQEFADQLDKLKQEKITILYLTNDVFIGEKVGDYTFVLKSDADLMTITM